jgi:hypothetical protein
MIDPVNPQFVQLDFLYTNLACILILQFSGGKFRQSGPVRVFVGLTVNGSDNSKPANHDNYKESKPYFHLESRHIAILPFPPPKVVL